MICLQEGMLTYLIEFRVDFQPKTYCLIDFSEFSSTAPSVSETPQSRECFVNLRYALRIKYLIYVKYSALNKYDFARADTQLTMETYIALKSRNR